MVVSNQKQIDTLNKKRKAGPKDRLELATARAAPEQTVTMKKDIINTQTPQEVQVEKQLENISTQNAVNAELLKQNKPVQPITEQPIDNGQITPEGITDLNKPKPTILGEQSVFKSEPGQKYTLPQVGQKLEDISGVILKPVAQIYDFVYSLTQGGKGIEQKSMEANFADVKASITQNLNLLSQGIGDADTIRKDIVTAEIINNEFSSSSKKWSTRGLRYYLTDGKDIQIQTELNKDSIVNWKLQLAAAEQQGMIKQLRAGL
jgi:hypothetical protein